jgi:malate synthase
MPPGHASVGDGFIQDVLPLIKNGFVILRSILDILIDRIEEAEKDRDIDVRKDIYASIIDALEAEVESIHKDEADAASAAAKIEVLEAVISVLITETEELDAKARKKGKRPKKVKID